MDNGLDKLKTILMLKFINKKNVTSIFLEISFIVFT